MNPYASNKYATQQIKQLTGDITKQYSEGVAPQLMAQFNAGGAYGGTAHQQALQNSQEAFAHQLAEASTGIRSQDAAARRDAWNQQLARQQSGLDANYQMYQDAQNDPYRKYGLLNDALRSIMGGYETKSATGPNPNYTSAAQNASAYAALIASFI